MTLMWLRMGLQPERQRVLIGRALMCKSKLLILDEPSLGLSPLLVEEMFALVGRLNADGLSVLLVEQNVVQSLAIAHRAYVLEHGAIAQAERNIECGRRQQSLDIALGQGFRQRAPEPRHRHLGRGVLGSQALAHLMAKETAERRQLAGRRLRSCAAGRALAEIGEHVRSRDFPETGTPAMQPLLQGRKVCSIRRQGIRSEPALHPGNVEKAQDQWIKLDH